MAISPDGARRAILKEQPRLTARVEVRDSCTLDVLSTTDGLAGFRSFAFASDGELLVAADSGLSGWNGMGATPVRRWTRHASRDTLQGGAKFPMLLPLRDAAYLGDVDGWLTRLQWQPSPRVQDVVQLGAAPILAGASNPARKMIPIGDGDGTLYLVDAASSRVITRKPSAHWAGITALVWLENRNLVSAGKDQHLRWWTWDSHREELRNVLEVRLRSNVKQLFAMAPPGARQDISRCSLILLRDGAYALERLKLQRDLFAGN